MLAKRDNKILHWLVATFTSGMGACSGGGANKIAHPIFHASTSKSGDTADNKGDEGGGTDQGGSGSHQAKKTGSQQDDGSSSPAPATSFDLFKDNVYPLTSKWCNGCHDAAQAPTFAAPDPEAAFKALTDADKVDLQAPEKSRLVLRLSADQHNCPADLGCAKAASEMLDAISVWKNGLPASTKPTRPRTDPQTLIDGSIRNAATNPNAGAAGSTANKTPTPVTLIYDLTALTKIPNASLSVEVLDYNATAYSFSKLKLNLPAGARLHIADIHLLINGNYRAQDATFTIVDVTATTTETVLSNATLIATKDLGAERDLFAFDFGTLK